MFSCIINNIQEAYYQRLMDRICTRHPWSSDLGLITKIMQDFFAKVVDFTKKYSPELKDCLFVYFNAMFAEILARPMESSLVNHGIHNILELFGWWPFTTRNMLSGFVSVSVPLRTWQSSFLYKIQLVKVDPQGTKEHAKQNPIFCMAGEIIF